jgi:uncharacterized protein
MSDDDILLTDFDGTARLFPLPDLVLFPRVLQPLHIFEQRYRQMTAEALAGNRLIALVLLKDGWDKDYENNPAIHPVACLGRIVADQRLEDGRYNFLLRGLSRARIVREVPTDKLYRTAEVVLVSDIESQGSTGALARQRLVKAVTGWFTAQAGKPEQLNKVLQSELPLGALADILSFALPLGAEVKQGLLEEFRVEQRVECLLEFLSTGMSPDRRFPPGFSIN